MRQPKLPRRVATARGDPAFYQPPPGMRLVVTVNGVRVRDVVAAERGRRGWVRALHVLETGDGTRAPLRDGAGALRFRYYDGDVRFALVDARTDLLDFTPLRDVPNVVKPSRKRAG